MIPRRAHPHRPSTRSPPRPAGSRAPTRTCRTSRSAPRSGGRCAPASSPSRGNRLLSADYNQVELRVLAHVAGEDVLREIFASGEDVHAATAAEIIGVDPDAISAGRALEGEDGQLRDRLRPDRLRARRPAPDLARGGAAPTSTATSSGSRRSSGSSTRRSRKAEQEGLVKTLMGRRRRIPELRSHQRQRRSLGERLAVNTVIQGTAADIIKLAMVRCHRALADAGPRDAADPPDPRRAAVRGPRGRDGARRRSWPSARCATAFELDPPLAVDVGIGPDWLAAK